MNKLMNEEEFIKSVQKGVEQRIRDYANGDEMYCCFEVCDGSNGFIDTDDVVGNINGWIDNCLMESNVVDDDFDYEACNEAEFEEKVKEAVDCLCEDMGQDDTIIDYMSMKDYEDAGIGCEDEEYDEDEAKEDNIKDIMTKYLKDEGEDVIESIEVSLRGIRPKFDIDDNCWDYYEFDVETSKKDYKVFEKDNGEIFIRVCQRGAGWTTLDGQPAWYNVIPYSPELLTQPNFKYVGKWWKDKNIDLIKYWDETVYTLNGWDGKKFGDCRLCVVDIKLTTDFKYILKPFYRYQLKENAGVDLDFLKEHDDKEYQHQCEIMDFDFYDKYD